MIQQNSFPEDLPVGTQRLINGSLVQLNENATSDTYSIKSEIIANNYRLLRSFTFSRDEICRTAKNALSGYKENLNHTLCFPYNNDFYHCIKWKLDVDECLVLNDGSVLYAKSTHSRLYSMGAYNISSAMDGIHVCIPKEYLVDIIFAGDLVIVILWILSAVCLAWLLIACPLVQKYRNGILWPLMCHALSLLIRYIVQITYAVLVQPLSHDACCILASTGHVSLIAATTWLNVINFDMWTHFHQPFESSFRNYNWHKFLVQSLYGWGMSAAVFVVALAFHLLPSPIIPGFKESCLIAVFENRAQVVFYLASGSILTILNIILVVATFCVLCRRQKEIVPVNIEMRQKMIYINLQLLILSGFSWLLLLVSRACFPASRQGNVKFGVEVVASLQGVFLLAIYVVTPVNRKILQQQIFFCNQFSRRPKNQPSLPKHFLPYNASHYRNKANPNEREETTL